MIIVLSESFSFFGVKQVVTSDKLENHAGERPNIGTLVVLPAKDNLR